MTDDELRAIFDGLRGDLATTREEVRQDIAAIRKENADAREDIAAIREENATTRQDIAAIRKENADAHAETRRHFDVALEAARSETQLVAEGVTQTRESLSRVAAELDEKIERTATETQAMIKFSHSELDRRLRTLEDSHGKLGETVANLQARVERLEGSTH